MLLIPVLVPPRALSSGFTCLPPSNVSDSTDIRHGMIRGRVPYQEVRGATGTVSLAANGTGPPPVNGSPQAQCSLSLLNKTHTLSLEERTKKGVSLLSFRSHIEARRRPTESEIMDSPKDDQALQLGTASKPCPVEVLTSSRESGRVPEYKKSREHLSQGNPVAEGGRERQREGERGREGENSFFTRDRHHGVTHSVTPIVIL